MVVERTGAVFESAALGAGIVETVSNGGDVDTLGGDSDLLCGFVGHSSVDCRPVSGSCVGGRLDVPNSLLVATTALAVSGVAADGFDGAIGHLDLAGASVDADDGVDGTEFDGDVKLVFGVVALAGPVFVFRHTTLSAGVYIVASVEMDSVSRWMARGANNKKGDTERFS